MSAAAEELFYMTRTTHELISRLVAYRSEEHFEHDGLLAGKADNDVREAIVHLLRAQSCLASGAITECHASGMIAI